ncbi:hypothetical protein GOHSU_02_00410 [Gordonia hirsuta DSM 44140 = NBRC 16056]|uniref:Uncharacterized protein n=1 Tax=Gordonia hirsuta DSM 44140 = NBRC 16056 TaxID=1121927 RepID=L7L795_9ACTN|nr:hypothetical protein [Gordonia hirsuta]GAC55898.1 hypothetical protein GOHSU_02_00410 [Gordonia hirsuta DSM 44140 = NBRC 16056]
MTALNETFARHRLRPATVDVFGVPWPAYKAYAVLAGLLTVVTVLAFGGPGVTAMWASAVVVLTVWWGQRAALSGRWDHGGRDHHARS